jgi:NTE family protein
LKCDAVFEGGGVKGIAFIGAIQETERRGYTFHRIAGTSAGSLIGSLLAAGYTGDELEEILTHTDFIKFMDQNWICKFPLIGRGLNIMIRNGVYLGQKLESWIGQKLKVKGVETFGDLPEGKLKIIASDISNGRILILPDDLPQYGIDQRSFPIKRAVRMSSSIPYFFEPAYFYNQGKRVIIVDGGLLSNYPVWLFDSRSTPRWPTFGYRLRGANPGKMEIKGPLSLLIALVSTMLEAHDRRYIEEHDAARTIFIPVEDVKATDFQLTEKKRRQLVNYGKKEAKDFFDRWNFVHYIEHHRQPVKSIKIPTS